MKKNIASCCIFSVPFLIVFDFVLIIDAYRNAIILFLSSWQVVIIFSALGSFVLGLFLFFLDDQFKSELKEWMRYFLFKVKKFFTSMNGFYLTLFITFIISLFYLYGFKPIKTDSEET